jgi:hypothetical protein
MTTRISYSSSIMPSPPPPPPSSSSPPPKTSLDILNPPRSSTIRTPEEGATASHLETLSTQLIQRAAHQDFTHPIWTTHLHPKFTGEFSYALETPDQTPVRDFAGFVAHHRALREKYPDYFFEVVNASADVHERNGTASVYVLLRVTGCPSREIERASILVLRWRHCEDLWRCYREGVIRGIQWHS